VKMYLADKTVLDIMRMRDARIRVHSDSIWKLQKVQQVLELNKYLIPMGQLNDQGDAIKFHGGKWKVCMGGRVVASGHKTSTLYMTSNPNFAR
jgi:hypothetical protein